MDIQLMKSSYPKVNSFPGRWAHKSPCWSWKHRKSTAVNYLNRAAMMDSIKLRGGGGGGGGGGEVLSVVACKRSFLRKASGGTHQSIDDSITETKGTVAGAVALIVGTSIGSGILALPKKTSPAGFIPSAACMILCWGFLLIEALLLAEINVGLRSYKKKRGEDNGSLDIISIRTMAQETLGHWGGTLATINYIFLAYTSMVAYTSKSGEILSHLINLPMSVSGIFFTALFTFLISVGGTQLTDRINQWLTASMIGLLVVIEVIAAASGGWSGLSSTADWNQVPFTIPVIIFSLVYHDLSPVICTYLGSDLARIRTSVIVGSLVPLVALLVWDAVALGLSPNSDGIDPLDLLMRVEWSGVPVMVQVFSLLAVGTSLIGTILGFSQFFEEQFTNLSFSSPSTKSLQEKSEGTESGLFSLRKWWGSNRINFMSTVMVVAPPIFISTTVPDAFSAATDIAGGYCMTMLYGVLPPAMAWAMHAKLGDGDDDNGGEDGQKALSVAKPALLGVGLLACGIVMEQILQDLTALHP